MKDMSKDQRWEKTIMDVCGKNNPCLECLVSPRCKKSFAGGSACEKLAKALEESLEVIRSES